MGPRTTVTKSGYARPNTKSGIAMLTLKGRSVVFVCGYKALDETINWWQDFQTVSVLCATGKWAEKMLKPKGVVNMSRLNDLLGNPNPKSTGGSRLTHICRFFGRGLRAT